MIITCERCDTSFNLDESLLKEAGSKVRCSVCKTVFTAYPAGVSDEPDSVESGAEAEQFFAVPDRGSAEGPPDGDAGHSEALADLGDESDEMAAEDLEMEGRADLDSDELEDVTKMFGAAEDTDVVEPESAGDAETFDFDSDLETDEPSEAETIPEEAPDVSDLEDNLDLEEAPAESQPEYADDDEDLDLDLDLAFEEILVEEEMEGEDLDLAEQEDGLESQEETEVPTVDQEGDEEEIDLDSDLAFEETPASDESTEEEIDLSGLEDKPEPGQETETGEVDTEGQEEALDLDLDLAFDETPASDEEGEELDLSELEDSSASDESASEAEAGDADEDEALELDLDMMKEDAEESDEEIDEIDLSGIEGLEELEEDAESEEKSDVEEEAETLDLDFAQPDAEQDTEDEAAFEDEALDLSDIEKMIGDEETPETAEEETAEIDDILTSDEDTDVAAEAEAASGAVGGAVLMEDVEEEEELEDITEEEEPVAEKKKKPGRKKRIGAPVMVLLILLLLGGGGYGAYIGLTSMGIQIPYMDSLKNIASQIPFLGDFIQPTVQDAGNLKISTIDITGKFVNNAGGGKLFVITGSAKNGYAEPRSLIKINGRLYSKGKQLVKSETVYCGNILTDEQLANMDLETIKKRLNNRAGQNKLNMNIAPGRVVPFMIVFSGLPENLEEYTIEVVESFPAASK